jgi:hypothetical protein
VLSRSTRRATLTAVILWGIIGAAGLGLELTATRLGPALHADSAAYIGGRGPWRRDVFSRLSGPTVSSPSRPTPGLRIGAGWLRALAWAIAGRI